jgi:hypothetical protein
MGESLITRKTISGGGATYPTFTFGGYSYDREAEARVVVDSFKSATSSGTIQTGDLLIFVAFSRGSSDTNENITQPANTLYWTDVMDEFDAGDTNLKVYACVDNGITSTQDFTGLFMGTESFAAILAFRPDKPINLLNRTHSNGTATISDPPAQTIDFSTFRDDLPRIAIAVYGASGAIVGETSSVDMTELSLNSDFQIRYKIYNPGVAGESITIDMGDEGDNAMGVALVGVV